MKCAKCGIGIPSNEGHEHSGRVLCEDCYIDAMAAPKTCDPWAVYSAKKMGSQNMSLTTGQQRIYDLLKAKGPLTLERILTELGISEDAFRNNFATLRHMELARGCKIDGQVCFALFDDPSA